MVYLTVRRGLLESDSQSPDPHLNRNKLWSSHLAFSRIYAVAHLVQLFILVVLRPPLILLPNKSRLPLQIFVCTHTARQIVILFSLSYQLLFMHLQKPIAT